MKKWRMNVWIKKRQILAGLLMLSAWVMAEGEEPSAKKIIRLPLKLKLQPIASQPAYETPPPAATEPKSSTSDIKQKSAQTPAAVQKNDTAGKINLPKIPKIVPPGIKPSVHTSVPEHLPPQVKMAAPPLLNHLLNQC